MNHLIKTVQKAKTDPSHVEETAQLFPRPPVTVLVISRCQIAADQRQNDGKRVSSTSTPEHLKVKGIASKCRFARRSRPIGQYEEQT